MRPWPKLLNAEDIFDHCSYALRTVQGQSWEDRVHLA